MKKEYTWYPDNQGRFSEVFDSIEEAIENAQEKFDSKVDEYEVDEENSSVIIIGLVERFNIKSAVQSIVDDIQENLEYSINDFAFGSDWESEAQILDKHKVEFKEKTVDTLYLLIKKFFYFSPEMKSIPVLKYDLAEKKYL